MRSCRRDGCSVAQGRDRTGTVTVTVTVAGRVDRSYRIPCTLCGATTCDRRRLEAGQEKGRQVEKGFKHWQPISSFPNCNTQPWQRAKKLDVPGHFNAGPGAKTLSLLSHAMSKQRPSVPPTLWQMAGTCHGELDSLTTQRPPARRRVLCQLGAKGQGFSRAAPSRLVIGRHRWGKRSWIQAPFSGATTPDTGPNPPV